MIGLFFRLLIGLLVLAGLAVLFFYAALTALFVAPFVLIFLYFMGRRVNAQWATVYREQGFQRRDNGPVIDHDPNDLPPRDDR